MGAPAGAGGSDRSDEKKVDTYSDQLKKIQKKKSSFKTDSDGNTKPKNIVDKIIDNSPTIQIAKNLKDKNNLGRRMRFANKNNVSLQGLSTEQILSKDFRSQLDAKGYAKTLTSREGYNKNNGGGNDNNTQTVIKKNIGGRTIQTTAPTTAEISQSAAANADDIFTRKKKTKATGRSVTILNRAKGISSDAGLTLGKKSLLGS